MHDFATNYFSPKKDQHCLTDFLAVSRDVLLSTATLCGMIFNWATGGELASCRRFLQPESWQPLAMICLTAVGTSQIVVASRIILADGPCAKNGTGLPSCGQASITTSSVSCDAFYHHFININRWEWISETIQRSKTKQNDFKIKNLRISGKVEIVVNVSTLKKYSSFSSTLTMFQYKTGNPRIS